MKYRVVMYYDEFAIQFKVGFWWLYMETLGEYIATFPTLDAAREKIEEMERHEKEDGKVVYEK